MCPFDSSVGRASDCRSECRVFDSRSKDTIFFIKKDLIDSLVNYLFLRKTKMIELSNGVKMHYLEYYKASSNSNTETKTLLFLHGSCQSCHTYDDAIDIIMSDKTTLQYNLRILSVDLRGHGDSLHCDSYELEYFVQDIILFIESLKLTNVVLIGMSLGGLVTLKTIYHYITEQNNENILASKAIIIDITPDELKGGATDIRKSVKEAPVAKPLDDWIQWAQSFNPHRTVDNLKRRFQFSLKQLDNGLYTWKYDHRYLLPTSQEASNKLWKEVETIANNIQLLVLIGGRSTVTNEIARQRLVNVTGAEIVTIPDAGHSVQGDQPEAFVYYLMKHISS
jgi:pimeloyl-ACP methyl ester carboxylesterase